MKEFFTTTKFRQSTLDLIAKCNEILSTLYADGYTLTLRQLYYQLVARAIIENKQREYKNLSVLMNNARLAGLTDWDWMEDRTRNLQSVGHWVDPAHIIRNAANGFRLDKWIGQKYHVEVWVEKDALIGVVERAARELDVSWFSCRGYVSQSEIYFASKRLLHYSKLGQIPVIIHLGDHDPSGIDMTRDIGDRLKIFMHPRKVIVKRVALTMEQIEELSPPPNPAKQTDSRFEGYQALYGEESWELDALSPAYINELIQREVAPFRNQRLYDERKGLELTYRRQLTEVSDRFSDVVGFLDRGDNWNEQE